MLGSPPTILFERQAERRKFHHLDALRGLASVFVMTRHAPTFFGENLLANTGIMVDLFFVLSGLVVANAYERKLSEGRLNGVSFALVRLNRTYPLYLLGTLIGAAVAALTIVTGLRSALSGYDWHLLGLATASTLGLLILPAPPGLGSQELLYPLNAVAWSLAAEIGINVFYGFTYKLWSIRYLVITMGLSAIILILLAVKENGDLDVGWNWHNWIGGVARIGYSFPAGVLIFRLMGKKHWNFSALHWTLPFICLFGIVLLHSTGPTSAIIAGASIFFVFPLLVWVAAEKPTPSALVVPFETLGLTSYAVYALHRPVLSVINGLLQWRHLKIASYAPWSGVLFTILFFIFCFQVTKYVDLPIRAWVATKISLGSRRGGEQRT